MFLFVDIGLEMNNMDWHRVLANPSLLDKAWYKDVRAPPITQLKTRRPKIPDPIPDALTYECVNCTVPVFTDSLGKETSYGDFAAGVKEEFLIFKKSFGVVIDTDSVTFNCNIFDVVTCEECGTELGYFLVESRRRRGYKKHNESFWARGERIRSRDTSRDVNLMKFVEEKANLVSDELEMEVCWTGFKPILTPKFMAEAGSAAVDIANHLLGNDPRDSLVPLFSRFLAEEPERLGDKQYVVQNP